MKIFCGGMIKEDYRGNLSVIVVSYIREGKYDTFTGETNSEAFVDLTGRLAAKHPLNRVYIGVNNDGEDAICNAVNSKLVKAVDLIDIDKIVVEPFFLYKIQENPEW